MKFYYKNRRILAVLGLLLITFTFIQPRRAQAVAPLVLAPEVITIVLAGITAAGIAVANNDNAAAIAQAAYDGMSEAGQNAISNAAAMAENGIAHLEMTADMVADWLAGVDSTQTAVDSGAEYEGTTSGQTTTVVGPQEITMAPVHGVLNLHYTFAQPSNNQVQVQTIGGDGSRQLYISFSNVWPGGGYPWYTHVDVGGGGITPYLSGSFPNSVDISVHNSEAGTQWYVGNQMIWEDVGDGEYLAKIHLAGDTTLDWDISGSYGQTLAPGDITTDEQKKVAFPPTWTGTTMDIPLDGSTPVGTVNPPVTGVDSLTTTNTWLGNIAKTLNNTLTKISAATLALTGAITKFFDLTVPVNFEPLKLTGVGLITLFPFSLPWDVARIVGAFSSAEWNGIITAQFPAVAGFGGYLMTFDLTPYDGIRTATKSILLVCFNLGLIMITRKIMGGDV